jgi:hypothetical protein
MPQKELQYKFTKNICLMLLGWAISFMVLYVDIDIFIKYTFLIGLGMGVWFFVDYELLRIPKYYFQFFLLALSFFGYGLIVQIFVERENLLLIVGVLYPITFLIIQRPLRLIYISILKKEPKVERYGSFSDLVYTIILFLGIAVLPSLHFQLYSRDFKV